MDLPNVIGIFQHEMSGTKTRPGSFKNWGEKQADCYFDEINAAIALIAENPEIGFACDYIREGYRQYHINRHFVFYRISATKIHIVRVLHDSMNFKAHF